MEIGAHKKRKHCFPSCPGTHRSPPKSYRSGVITRVISENHAVLCSFVLGGIWQASAVTIMPTGRLGTFATSDGIFGSHVVCALHCFNSFEVGIGTYFSHLFLLWSLSCGLTSFHAPWAVPSPMTRVWAGLLTSAINTFLQGGTEDEARG